MKSRFLTKGRYLLVCLVVAFGAVLPASCSERPDIDTGRAALERGDNAAALRLLLPHAESGNPEAQYLVATIFQSQRDGAEQGSQNRRNAVKWFGRAADQGHVKAQAQLGTLLLVGHGISEAQRKRAIALLQSAAKAGDSVGQVMLGTEIAMRWNLGHPRHEEGLEWLEKAAAQKHAGAFHWLAQIREIDSDAAHHRGNAAQARDFRIEVLKWTLLGVLVAGEFQPLPAAMIVKKYDSPYDTAAVTETVRRADAWIKANGIEGIDSEAAKRKLLELRRQIAK